MAPETPRPIQRAPGFENKSDRGIVNTPDGMPVDTQNVLGHPDNPFTGANTEGLYQSKEAEDAGTVAVAGTVEITGVPTAEELRNQQ